jgi:hypothetical protein
MKHLLLLLGLGLLLPQLVHGEPEISFRQQVLPILMRECSYCHMREDNYGYLVIEGAQSWSNLVNVPASELPAMNRVEPGNPEQSYLWLKLSGKFIEAGGSGWAMPFNPMLAADKAIVHDWIEQGALDN